MPLLVLFLHVSPVDAVGTALIFMCVTKIWATLLHWKQGTMDFRLVRRLATGSVPGALAGAVIFAVLQFKLGPAMNHLLRLSVGFSLVLVSSVALIADLINNRFWTSGPSAVAEGADAHKAILIGFAGGLLVSVTSVGSGSFIAILLLMFCSRSPSVLVGTDILHGLILAVVAALAHPGIGHTDLRLVGLLLAGSLGGVPLGTRIAAGFAPVWLRKTVFVMAIAGGIAML
jgi:uncharacterized protein